MQKNIYRTICIILTVLMVVTILPINSMKATASTIDYSTGDIIEFGSYPQTRVTDSSLISTLNAQTLQADNTVTYGISKYKRIYFTQYTPSLTTDSPTAENSYQDDNDYFINIVYWFKIEPIQWRVLSNTNGELFVMAEKILGSRAYNQVYTNVTWETCTMRAWLNNEFYGEAFNATEKAKIKTSDKIFLLSYSEVTNPSYGFGSSYDDADTARMAQGTDFSKSQGLWVNLNSSWDGYGNSEWMLSSLIPSNNAYGVSFTGIGGEADVNSTQLGVRPAIKIKLTSEIFTSKAGSNCIIDYLNNLVYGLAPGITSLDDYVDVATGYGLSYVPTSGRLGTGTIVNLMFNGEVIESYIIVIYGDVNGDSSIDSIDAGMQVDYENYIVSWHPQNDAAYLKSGDLNGDGHIDSIDAGITVDVENYRLYVDQVTGHAMTVEQQQTLTPYDYAGVPGTSRMCETVTQYCETMPVSPLNNLSYPLTTPLLTGTFDYIDGESSYEEFTYYNLRSGKRVNQKDVKVIDSGYNLPSNRIRVISSATNGATNINLSMLWKVPVNTIVKGQNYAQTYNSREFGVWSFTGNCIEFAFSYTDEAMGTVNVAGSNTISAAEWSKNASKNEMILRLYFKRTGVFYGYNISYNSDGSLKITIKNKPSSSLAGYNIMLDPGHGGTDPGAICSSTTPSNMRYEKQINLALAQKIKERLESNGASIILTRSSDSDVSLDYRRNLIYEKKPDMCISIHCDASTSSSSTGTSAYYYYAQSFPLANAIQMKILTCYSSHFYTTTDRHSVFYPYRVTRTESCPSILVEYGFVSNLIECQTLQNNENQNKFADATVQGIIDYINLN